ncbi:MAG: helix-turn-helix domain-containing protein [Candidatus Sericytochromatia bacterium]|nr:helix-turn-helix domain-containing protein [Candidatus Sericytochromatia bacterium]
MLAYEDQFLGAGPLATGQLVRALDGDWGVGQVAGVQGSRVEVRYMAALDVEWTHFHDLRHVVRVRLAAGTPCLIPDEGQRGWRAGWIRAWREDAYEVAAPEGGLERLEESNLRVLCARLMDRPQQLLALRGHGNPLATERRRELVRQLVAWRGSSRGLWGLLSAKVPLEPHHVEIVRRVLEDPVPRYWLADADWTDRAFEAAAVIRQHCLEEARTQVVLLAPEGLLARWRALLMGPFRLESLVDRLLLHALEQPLAPAMLRDCTLLVLDEPLTLLEASEREGGGRHDFERLRQLAHQVPGLLLMEARAQEVGDSASQALLHLLDPSRHSWPLGPDLPPSRLADGPLPAASAGRRLETSFQALQHHRLVHLLQPSHASEPLCCWDELTSAGNLGLLLEAWREAAQRHAASGGGDALAGLAALWRRMVQAAAVSPTLLRSLVRARLRGRSPAPLPQDWPAEPLLGVPDAAPFPGEADLLQALEAALGTHDRDGLNGLCDRLIELAVSGKVVVFSSHPAVALALYQRCATEMGLTAVAFHIHPSPPGEREEERRRFDENESCRVMVCDPASEGALGLLEATWFVHADLSGSLAQVVPRLAGRARLAQRARARHLVFLGATATLAYQRALLQALHRHLDVFAGESPLSGALLNELESVLQCLFLSGEPDLPERLGQAILGAKERAEAARQANPVGDGCIHLDDGVRQRYEALMASEQASEAFRAAFEGWMFDVLRIPFSVAGCAPERPVGMAAWFWQRLAGVLQTTGTFDRAEALSRPDLALFRPGDPLVDQVLQTLRWNQRGQASALWRQTGAWSSEPGQEWLGLRVEVVVEADDEPFTRLAQAAQWREADMAWVRRRADAHCPPRVEQVFLGADLREVTAPELKAILEAPYSEEPGGHQDWPLVRDLLASGYDVLPVQNWSTFVERGSEAARGLIAARWEVQDHLARQLALPEGELESPEVREGELAWTPAPPAENTWLLQEALLEAVRHPRLRIDSITLMVVSGRAPRGVNHKTMPEGPRHLNRQRPALAPLAASEVALRVARREARGLSIRALANLTGVALERLAAFEARGTTLPQDALARLDRTLEVLAEVATEDARDARVPADGRLTMRRQAAGFSQADLAARLRVPLGVVSALEMGKVSPSRVFLTELELALGQTPRTPAPPAPAPEVESPPAPPAPAAEVVSPPAPPAPATEVVSPPAPPAPAPEVVSPPVPAAPAPEITRPPAPSAAQAPLDPRTLRKQKGVSQRELADMLGISTAALSFHERGTKSLAPDKAEGLTRILHCLADVSSVDFLGDRLARRLAERGWDAAVLAERSGVALDTIAALLAKGFDNAAREDLRRMAAALGSQDTPWHQTAHGWQGPTPEQLAELGVPLALLTHFRAGTMMPAPDLLRRLQSLRSGDA